MTELYALSTGDIIIQIVPQNINTLQEKSIDKLWSDREIVSIPDEHLGYNVPMKMFYVENVEKEFCGVFEVGTIYYNTLIKRDIINDMYDNDIKFDIYVRQWSSKEVEASPKILQIFNNVRMNSRDFIVPEVGGDLVSYRYYFTNIDEPWNIPIEKIEAMKPVNQYIYDYAVSKAVKDLKYPIENLTKTLLEIKKALCPEPEQAKILTPSQYIANCQAGKL